MEAPNLENLFAKLATFDQLLDEFFDRVANGYEEPFSQAEAAEKLEEISKTLQEFESLVSNESLGMLTKIQEKKPLQKLVEEKERVFEKLQAESVRLKSGIAAATQAVTTVQQISTLPLPLALPQAGSNLGNPSNIPSTGLIQAKGVK